MQLTLDDEQREAVERMASEPTRACLNASDTGCIQGDAVLTVNRGGKSFQITLKELVHMYNGGERGRWGSGYTWDERIPTRVQRRAKDGTIRLVDIVDAWYSGQKMTYTVTTKGGRTIRATDEHPFYTEHSWKRLDELRVGTRVRVEGGQQSGRPRKPKNYYLYRSKLKFHPHARSTKNKPNLCRVATHRLVVEADMNGLAFEEYISALRTGVGVEEFKFLDPRSVVHHKDHNHRNNALSNLEVYGGHEEHARLHSREFQSHVLQKTELDAVVSIEPFGIEDTYDIEVADDPHNFIANGFVVHNTGKTLLSVELAKEIGAKTVLVIGPANPRVIDSWRRTFEGQGFPYPFQKIDRKNYLSIDYANPEHGVYYVSKEFARRHDVSGNQDRDINWRKSRFDMVIADESHFSTNRKAGVTKTLWNLRNAGYRLALSATPQGSNFAGFWSLCRFLWYDYPHPDATEDSPRWEKFIIDPSYHRWEAVWCETAVQYIGRGQQVKKVIGPKGDDPTAFIKSLPCYVALKATRKPVEVREVSVTLTSQQRKIYDEMLMGAVAWLDENSVLTADYPMTKRIRLHQATLGYPIIDEENDTVAFDHSKESPKADAIQAIKEIEHPGERIVVFTSSEKFTRLLAERIPDAVLWTGPISKRQRQKNLEAFLDGTSKMLIATYPAISEGMDGLQHVCHVEIRADEAGSVVQETQVNGRLNRRGQKADKIIRYRLLAEDTADTERVEALIDNVRDRRSEL